MPGTLCTSPVPKVWTCQQHPTSQGRWIKLGVILEASLSFPFKISSYYFLFLFIFYFLFGHAMWHVDFPGGSDGKESACNAGDTGFIPGWRRFPGKENCYPLQYSCLENSVTEESGGLYSPWGHKESNTTERLTHTHTHSMQNVSSLTRHRTHAPCVGSTES